MLKNIEKARTKGITIRKDWLNPNLYTDPNIRNIRLMLKQLELRAPGEKSPRKSHRSPAKKMASQVSVSSPTHVDGALTLNQDFSNVNTEPSSRMPVINVSL